ncbi:MAG: hemerythrin domain-containing protein [Oligoflexales bacterium]
MDILFLLKFEQENVLKLLEAFKGRALGSGDDVAVAYKNFKDALNMYFSIDEEFLYQEIGELFPNACRSIDYGIKLHREVGIILAKLDSALGSSIESCDLAELVESLCQAVNQHIEHQQEHIIPRMRERIPTQEREDLAEVFSEIKEDLERGSSVSRASDELVI